ncbi:MAG: hypothetical protein ACLTUL_20435 [Blautia faecis]
MVEGPGHMPLDQIEANMKSAADNLYGGAILCTGTACDGYRAWI